MQLSFFDLDVRQLTTDSGVTLPHKLLVDIEERVRGAFDDDRVHPPPWPSCDHKDASKYAPGFRSLAERHCFGADAAMGKWVGKETPLRWKGRG